MEVNVLSNEVKSAPFDVVVVGGGISGVCAAMAAARQGATVLLIEKNMNLGGVLTDSLVGPMMTFHSPRRQVSKGILQEIVDRLITIRGSCGHIIDPTGFVETITPFVHEKLKTVLFDIMNESGVTCFLGAPVAEVVTEDGFVRSLIVPYGVKEYVLEGKVFVDATGDGSFSIKSGAAYWVGDELTKECQPMSLILRVSGVDKQEIIAYIKEHPEDFQLRDEPSKIDFSYLAVSGFYTMAKLFHKYDLSFKRDRMLFFQVPFREDEFLINTNRYPGYASNPEELTRAQALALSETWRFMEFLRREVPGFRSVELVQTGSIGVRETNHIVADYTLRLEDITSAKKFEKPIAIGAYPIDVHQSTSDGLKIIKIPYPGEYEIPLETLLPKQLKNVVLAGRNASASHIAYAATRVSGVAGAVGMAAGICAALAAKVDGNIRKVDYLCLRKRIVEMGGVL